MKERERTKRISRNRQAGNLLEFSPPGRLQKKSKRNTKSLYGNELMLDLSPGGNDSISDGCDKLLQLEDVNLKDKLLQLEDSKNKDNIQKSKQQETIEQELFAAKEQLAVFESKLEASEEEVDSLRSRIEQLEDDLKNADAERKKIVSEYARATEDQKLKVESEREKEKNYLSKSIADSKQTVLELQEKLKDLNERYNESKLQCQIAAQALLSKEKEYSERNKLMEERLTETQQLLSCEKEGRKMEKYESSAKETTIRQLSSVLEATKEKERLLEESINKLEKELEHTAKIKGQHSSEEFKDIKLQEEQNEIRISELNSELNRIKDLLEKKELSFEEMKRQYDSDRKNFENYKTQVETRIISKEQESADLRKENLGLEQRVASLQKELNSVKSTLKESEASYEKLVDKFSKASQESDTQASVTEILQKKLVQETKLRRNDANKIEEMQESITKAQSTIDHLRKELACTIQQLKDTAIERDQNRNRLVTFDAREDELLRKLRVMDDVRRTLHNRVIQLSGNIRVFVRVRPIIEREKDARPKSTDTENLANRGIKRKQSHEANVDECPFEFPCVGDRDENMSPSQQNDASSDDLTKQIITATEPFKDRGGLKPRRKTLKFGFDRVFSPEHDQFDVWLASEPLVQSAVDGYNVCIFAYGMTGSGKTHTMLGGSDPASQGLIYRAVSKLFSAKREIEQGSDGAIVDMSVELLEIYNEHIRDLLTLKKQGLGDEGLKIISNESVGNIVASVESEEDVLTILELAQSRRCVKATNSNAESSRSHLIFTMHFDVLRRSNKLPIRSGKLHICDLAGSERLGKSGSHGSMLKETQAINKSLMNLSNVIEKLQEGEAHIPYRDSKLTHLLQNSLGGDSKTLCVVCCNPLPEHFNESICSLRFASKVSRVELKAVSKVNV